MCAVREYGNKKILEAFFDAMQERLQSHDAAEQYIDK